MLSRNYRVDSDAQGILSLYSGPRAKESGQYWSGRIVEEARGLVLEMFVKTNRVQRDEEGEGSSKR